MSGDDIRECEDADLWDRINELEAEVERLRGLGKRVLTNYKATNVGWGVHGAYKELETALEGKDD